MELSSSAFHEGGMIPPIYTCDGQDISPTQDWSDPPAGTRQFALEMDDADTPGGTWTH